MNRQHPATSSCSPAPAGVGPSDAPSPRFTATIELGEQQDSCGTRHNYLGIFQPASASADRRAGAPWTSSSCSPATTRRSRTRSTCSKRSGRSACATSASRTSAWRPRCCRTLNRGIKAQGAISYLEVVGTTPEACLRSVRVGLEIGVDRLLGGTDVDAALEILRGQRHRLLPVPGLSPRPSDRARRRTRGRGGPLRGLRRQGLRRRRPAGLSRDRGGAARSGAGGAPRARRPHADRRRQRRPAGAHRARSPTRAPMPSRSARRCSTAPSRRARALSSRSCATCWPPAAEAP